VCESISHVFFFIYVSINIFRLNFLDVLIYEEFSYIGSIFKNIYIYIFIYGYLAFLSVVCVCLCVCVLVCVWMCACVS